MARLPPNRFIEPDDGLRIAAPTSVGSGEQVKVTSAGWLDVFGFVSYGLRGLSFSEGVEIGSPVFTQGTRSWQPRQRVGKIGRHTVFPPYTALLDLARAADNYAASQPGVGKDGA